MTVHLERLQPLLNQLHFALATYQHAVARSDVPVGLQHLIDVLIEDIVREPADPIIHLDSRSMYSTRDLTALMGQLVRGLEPPHGEYFGPRPIAFHLPALDPNNVLFSPVLAHEVAHTAVSHELLASLTERLRSGDVGDGIRRDVAAFSQRHGAERRSALSESFRSWSSELLCDAVAIAVSGPSFLFGFAAFSALGSQVAGGKTHPGSRDRLRYALGLVDGLGWTDFLEARSPRLLSWFHQLAQNPALTGSDSEVLLRSSMDATADLRKEIAFAHVPERFEPRGEASRLDEAADWLQQGVPLIDIEGLPLTPWQTILAGWLAAIRVHGDLASTPARTASDQDFNAVIVKALEYSQIVSAWRTS